MAQYGKLADIYDYLVAGVDYEDWMDYMEAIIKRFDLKGKDVLDLACGTGNTTIPFAKRGYRPIGLDLSSTMLEKAKQKTEAEELKILYLEQDMRKLELPYQVDLAVCYHDGLNYIVEQKDLKQVFQLVSNNLKEQGLFIFDLVVIQKLSKAQGDVTFVDDEDLSLIWESNYFTKEDLWEITLTGFIKKGDLYEKFKETHQEKNHAREEVLEIIKETGFKLKGEFHSFSFDEPRYDTRRIFYVVQKES